MDLFRRLISFNINDHPTTAGISTHIGDILDEMETIRMPFTRDHLAGLVLQNGLASEPELQQEFDRRIEHDLQSATIEDPPMNFDEMVRLIDIIRRQIRFQNVNRSSTNPQTPLVMQAEANPSQTAPTTPQLPGPALHPDNTPDAHDFMAMQAGLCWQCRSPQLPHASEAIRSQPTSKKLGKPGQNPTRSHQLRPKRLPVFLSDRHTARIQRNLSPASTLSSPTNLVAIKPSTHQPSTSGGLLPTTTVPPTAGDTTIGIHRLSTTKARST
jgi:hypothetical protein